MKLLITSDIHRGMTPNTALIHTKWYRKVLSKQTFDALVVAGDLGSYKQTHVESAFRFLRKVADRRPVLVVRGNHDFWDATRYQPEQVLDMHRKWAKLYDIHLLDERPFVRDETAIVGWMGWYHVPGQSNDFNWIPRELPDGSPTNSWFKRLEAQQFDDAHTFLAGSNCAHRIAVTHFPIVPGIDHRGGERFNANPLRWDLIAPVADVLIMGHSHRKVCEERDGVILINAGSDYDKPKAVTLEPGGVYHAPQ